MNSVLTSTQFSDGQIALPPTGEQLRRLARDLNKLHPFAFTMLLSDRTTPLEAIAPIWRDNESLRLLRLVEKHLMPEVGRRIKASAENIGRDAEAVAGLRTKIAGQTYENAPSGQRQRWARALKLAIIPIAIAALAGFVGGYTSHALNHRAKVSVVRSREIRRAIPVEPEIRRAIPVLVEIRKAIPVQRPELGKGTQ